MYNLTQEIQLVNALVEPIKMIGSARATRTRPPPQKGFSQSDTPSQKGQEERIA